MSDNEGPGSFEGTCNGTDDIDTLKARLREKEVELYQLKKRLEERCEVARLAENGLAEILKDGESGKAEIRAKIVALLDLLKARNLMSGVVQENGQLGNVEGTGENVESVGNTGQVGEPAPGTSRRTEFDKERGSTSQKSDKNQVGGVAPRLNHDGNMEGDIMNIFSGILGNDNSDNDIDRALDILGNIGNFNEAVDFLQVATVAVYNTNNSVVGQITHNTEEVGQPAPGTSGGTEVDTEMPSTSRSCIMDYNTDRMSIVHRNTADSDDSDESEDFQEKVYPGPSGTSASAKFCDKQKENKTTASRSDSDAQENFMDSDDSVVFLEEVSPARSPEKMGIIDISSDDGSDVNPEMDGGGYESY